MYIIEVKISDDRFVKFENTYAGEIGENNITKLKFTVPEDYKDFYKYLDIIKSDGKKTQTVIDDMGNNVFYYTLPFSLTDKQEVTLQLVMKKSEKIFKSNIFVLHFNGSIDGTQKLEGDYQDTIQFLMENKASKEETKEINNKLPLKVDKSEYYNFYLKTNEELNKKVSNDEFLTFKNDNLNKLNLTVKKTDYASRDNAGVIKVAYGDHGVFLGDNKRLKISPASEARIKNKTSVYHPIVPARLEYAVEVCTNQDVDYPELSEKLPASAKAIKMYVERFHNMMVAEVSDAHADAKQYTDKKVADIVNSAPETLNTLKELSDALGNDENFATTVATELGNVERQIQDLNDHDVLLFNKIDDVNTQIGDIDLALDNIIAIQNELMGVSE